MFFLRAPSSQILAFTTIATVSSCLAAGCGSATGCSNDGRSGDSPVDDFWQIIDAGQGYDASDIDAGPPAEPSGYLLITKQRWAELPAEVAAGQTPWTTLKDNVDAEMDSFDQYRCGPENIALVYLLTGQQSYADAAYQWAADIIAADDVAFDSYLYFGDRMRQIALVLNYCYQALTADQRSALAEYLARWNYELWFDNQGSGWGLDDPGNNYHLAFLEGSAYAGYALRQAGYEQGQSYVDIVIDKIAKPGGVFEYLNTRARGGDWPEGANYGQRSKQRLFAALSVIASMGDTNFYTATTFFSEAIYYAFYQLQPVGGYLYPAGDLARDSLLRISPYEREYVQMATYWISDLVGRGYGQWFLENVVPDYTGPEFNARASYYLDALYSRDQTATSRSNLPLTYYAPGTRWLHTRSSWDDAATSLSIAGTPTIDQSHSHYDVGSFTLFKGDWLAVDATSYSSDGLNWDSGAHNMVHVAGHERRGGEVPGLVHYGDDAQTLYAQIDASQLFRHKPGTELQTMLNEYTRELVYLKPNRLVIYDRVDPKPAGTDYDFRIHFASQPTSTTGGYLADHGGGFIALAMLVGGSTTVLADTDLVGGGSNAWRVQVQPPSSGRFLAVLEVADSSAPALQATHVSSTGQVEGALLADQVVMFSQRSFGQSATLPFSYSIQGTEQRTHTLINMSSACEIQVSKQGGDTTVTVNTGSSVTPDAQGLVRFTQ